MTFEIIDETRRTWYVEVSSKTSEVIDETRRTIPPHATRWQDLESCPRQYMYVYAHYMSCDPSYEQVLRRVRVLERRAVTQASLEPLLS